MNTPYWMLVWFVLSFGFLFVVTLFCLLLHLDAKADAEDRIRQRAVQALKASQDARRDTNTHPYTDTDREALAKTLRAAEKREGIR